MLGQGRIHYRREYLHRWRHDPTDDLSWRPRLDVEVINIILYYLLAVNIATFFLYGIDKYKARKGRWRISEATLLLMAVFGCSIGAWAGMRLWHHKTMHKKFKYGIPIIIILQVALAVYLITNID
ncbi:MAG: DUF1294 domain-containing protein [Segatella copri]